jgi:hypothetical protein
MTLVSTYEQRVNFHTFKNIPELFQSSYPSLPPHTLQIVPWKPEGFAKAKHSKI